MPEFSIESAHRKGGKVQRLTPSFGVRDCALIEALAVYSSSSRVRARMDVFLSRDFLAQLGIFLARRNMSRLAGRKKIGPSAKTSYKVYFRSV